MYMQVILKYTVVNENTNASPVCKTPILPMQGPEQIELGFSAYNQES